VATSTLREVMSPLDRISALMAKQDKPEPDPPA
jgi:hypothetical protein